MQPALSVGVQSTAGVGSVDDGTDSYTTATVQESSLPDASPVTYIRVGRGVQPIGAAFYHVSVDPDQ